MNGSAFQVLAVFSGTAFYVFGICLASLALIVTAIGLRFPEAFSSRAASRGLVVLFAILVAGATTFAVKYSGHEKAQREAKLAAEEKKEGSTPVPGGGSVPSPDAAALGGIPSQSSPTQPQQAPRTQPQPTVGSTAGTAASKGKGASSAKPQPAAKGPGGTVKLAASPTQIAYTTTSLTSKAGKVTVNFTNPAPLQHDVAIAKGSQILGKSSLISQGSTSVSVNLAKGTYTFFCTVPGHRQAGMQGTLTVK